MVLARQSDNPDASAIAADFVLSLLVDMCRMNAGSSLRPVAVQLRRTRPKGGEVDRRHFGCVVHFAADEDSFTLSLRDVDRSLPTSNRQIAATLDRILVERLAHLDKRDVEPSSIDLELLAELSTGFTGAEIEQAVVSARYGARASKKSVDTELLRDAIQSTYPISVVMAEQIAARRAWARDRTVPA